MAAVDAQLTTATERVAALQSALDGQPTDEAVIREALSGLDRLDSQARAADESVRQARSQNTAAQATVRQVETDASVLRRSLQQTRDPLVALGAPQVDGSHLLASWTQLTEWAAAQSDSRLQALLAARPADEAAQAALRLAEKALADARTREAQARKAETEATASLERVRAALKGLQTRLGELTASLFDAPSDSDAQAQLAQIAELTATSRAADAALTAARSSREQAEDATRALDRQNAAAWQGLRRARDGLIVLGAPDLPDGSALSGWNTLISLVHRTSRHQGRGAPRGARGRAGKHRAAR